LANEAATLSYSEFIENLKYHTVALSLVRSLGLDARLSTAAVWAQQLKPHPKELQLVSTSPRPCMESKSHLAGPATALGNDSGSGAHFSKLLAWGT
jgi:hypothetical protein